MSDKSKTSYNIKVDSDFWWTFKKVALDKRMNIQGLITSLLEKCVKEHEGVTSDKGDEEHEGVTSDEGIRGRRRPVNHTSL